VGVPKQQVAKEKLLNASLALIREKGFSAMTVDDLCLRAGVTKGAFFHYFKSKEALGVAAAEHWSTVTGALFEQAPYHRHKEPLERVLAYIDFRRALLRGDIPEFTCVVGTMVQEVYDLHVTSGVRGIHFQRDQRDPVIHPLILGRFFAQAGRAVGRTGFSVAHVAAATGGKRRPPR
jgi:AcrR family transcriptional regulator